ncbi:MAG: hypothetical protein COT90_05715 [Candidatus Diapherotrites archaeon CG10_big_fil_rev_8_21_14_0_10_31_34]|nr:MAG: hypothetical protein COT90_05715 [Candidatus Diapherotrites archaeon CG10_big_fil_rev_8_21_14_0_10_31_34]
MEKKVVPGIWIQYKVDPIGVVYATFLMSQGTIGKNFISTQEIRKAIKKFEQKFGTNPFGKEIGYIKGNFSRANNTLTLENLYPFESVPRGEEIFGGKGLALFLENHFRQRVKRTFPSIRTIRGWDTSDKRFSQLIKMGIGKKMSWPYEEWETKLKRKIRVDTRKAKKKKRIARRISARTRHNLK